MAKKTIWRIEHKDTGLGPFQHSKQEVLRKGVYSNTEAFLDIDHIPEVKRILKQFKGKVFFGFTNKKRCTNAIRDKKVFDEHGFVIKSYIADILYRHKEDGQTLFLKE